MIMENKHDMNTALSVVLYFSQPVVVVRTYWAIGFLHEVKLCGHRSPRSQTDLTCRMLVTDLS